MFLFLGGFFTMSMMTTLTQELSARIIELLDLEFAPVMLIHGCGINTNTFVRGSNDLPGPILDQIVGRGYSTLRTEDTVVLETELGGHVQAFGAAAVLRKRKSSTSGPLVIDLNDVKKTSLTQGLDHMLNLVIGTDGLIESSQEIESGRSTIIILVASPRDGKNDCPFAKRLMDGVKRHYSRFKFRDIEPFEDDFFLYQGLFGIQS